MLTLAASRPLPAGPVLPCSLRVPGPSAGPPRPGDKQPQPACTVRPTTTRPSSASRAGCGPAGISFTPSIIPSGPPGTHDRLAYGRRRHRLARGRRLARRLVLAADTAPYGHVIIDETFSGWGVPAAVRASTPITDGNHTGAEGPARLTLHPGIRRAAAAVRQPERPVWPTGDPGTGADGLCGHLCAGGVRVDLGAADRGPGVDGCRRGAYLPGHAGADQQHLPRPGRPGPGHRDLGTR